MAKEYLDIFDRFDGGGAGQMGDRFAGGGILSMIANEFFTPYGSEDDDRKRRLLEMRGLFDALEAETTVGGSGAAAAPGVASNVRPQPRPVRRVSGYDEAPVTMAPRGQPGSTYDAVPATLNRSPQSGAPAAQPSSVADMPAGQFMDMLRGAGKPQPVPFGGFKRPGDEYKAGFEQMVKQLGADRVRNMSQDQLMQLLQIYARGGPVR